MRAAEDRALLDQLMLQVDKLMVIEPYNNINDSRRCRRSIYRSQLEGAIYRFEYRPELVGLRNVALVDHRISAGFMAQHAGIYCKIDPDNCSNYEGVVSEDRPLVIQFQFGEKWRKYPPRHYRENLHSLEQGITVIEIFTAYFYDATLIESCYPWIIGSVSDNQKLPTLRRMNGNAYPTFDDGRDNIINPYYGSATRGKS